MEISTIITHAFSSLWYFLPILFLFVLLKSSWFKGVFGEFIVDLLLKWSLPKDKYHLLSNVTLPTEGGTTQIDHIVVSKYGVFVIETKNMKGWIFGSPKKKLWTQKIYKHSSQFQNPIHQNYKHLKTLEDCLKINSDGIFSVIVFIGSAIFKTDMPKNVTHARGCIQYIQSKKNHLYTQEQIFEIIKIIQSGRLQPSLKTNREHVAHVKQIVELNKLDKICPKCRSKMVIRISKKGVNAGGKFWGCSAFPKCRSIIKIEE